MVEKRPLEGEEERGGGERGERGEREEREVGGEKRERGEFIIFFPVSEHL